MDRAYEGENDWTATMERVFEPVVLPKKNRRNPCEYVNKVTNSITKLNDSFSYSKDSAGFLLAMIKTMLCFVLLSFLLCSLMFFSVNIL